jgi:hypothetical protein
MSVCVTIEPAFLCSCSASDARASTSSTSIASFCSSARAWKPVGNLWISRPRSSEKGCWGYIGAYASLTSGKMVEPVLRAQKDSHLFFVQCWVLNHIKPLERLFLTASTCTLPAHRDPRHRGRLAKTPDDERSACVLHGMTCRQWLSAEDVSCSHFCS